MKYFIWEQRLNTGIDVIDEQHQAIASNINTLYASIQSQDKGMIDETIIQLLDYTQSHLAFEEQLLEAANYPGFAQHKLTHERFERRINRYFKQHFEGHAVALPLISELKMWLTTHILHEDNDYVPYIGRNLRGNELSVASSV